MLSWSSLAIAWNPVASVLDGLRVECRSARRGEPGAGPPSGVPLADSAWRRARAICRASPCPVTSGCVRATVDEAFARDYRMIIPAECLADRAEVPHRVNLFDMEMISADVLSLEEILPSARGRVDKPWRLWNGRACRWPARERR